MTRPASPAPTEPPARRFGREIGQALAGGADAGGLVLHLTLLDASKVKRDPELPLDHISFSPEGMRFLGVRVVQGGVRTSVLSSGEDPSPVEAPAPAPAPKTRAKKAKTAAAPR